MDAYLVTATKTYTWDMAHVLCDHQGLCKNLHGHTYKMQVTACRKNGLVEESTGPSNGMVVDFKELNNLVKKLIVDPLDHCTMIYQNTTDSFESELSTLLCRYGKKRALVTYRPTAENMSIAFLAVINETLAELDVPYAVVKIKVYETPTSYAEIMS